jgi:hypothetical protein
MIMTPAVSWYFRRRIFWGKEQIPNAGPLVLLGTHSASFLDAILMGVLMKRPIHFYVRGDIFGHPIVRWIFAQLHMIPVFSADLAKQDLHRNAASFDEGARILSKGGALLIFPEGISRLERNLMPFRKSPARILLQALQLDGSLQIGVLPIGIHFSRHAFRGDVQVVTGSVIHVSVQSIAQLFQDKEVDVFSARAVSLLTHQLRVAFENVVLYVAQDDRSILLERLLHLLDTDLPGMHANKFTRQRSVCRWISDMSDSEVVGWMEKTDRYHSLLANHGITDSGFRPGAGSWRNGLVLFIGFPFMVIGWLFHVIPYRFGRYMANTRVTREDFYTSVQLAVSAVGYLLWLAGWFLFWKLTPWEPVGWLVVCAPFMGLLTFYWLDLYKDWVSARKWEHMKEAERNTVWSLRKKLTIPVVSSMDILAHANQK